MQRKKLLNSPRLRELRKKKSATVRNKVLLFVILFLVLFTGFIFFAKWNEVNIQNIEVVGNQIVDAEQIQKVALEAMTGKYLLLFPKSNFLIYPRSDIRESLNKEFKRIKDFTLKVTDTKTLKITVSERMPVHTWCGEAIPSDSKCYFMDETGFIFDEAIHFSGEVYFKFYGPTKEGGESVIGSSFAPKIFANILTLNEDLKRMGIVPSSLLMKENGDIELYLASALEPPNSPKIIFDENTDLEKLIVNLAAALDTEPLKTDFKKKYSLLSYLDLRYGNKVHYKFK